MRMSAGSIIRFALPAVVVSAAAGLQAKENWYVFDSLGNTVASVNAAALVGEIESTAFGESRTPTAGARFTGKPYDADLGAHVFPFRNYRSDAGRWTSADPSGFPDGVNGALYQPNPVMGMDPLGLAKVTASTFTAGTSSGYLSFTIPANGRDNLAQVGSEISLSTGVGAFSLSNTTLGAGWIVQQVTFDYSWKESASSTARTFTTTYYEAWSALMPVSGGGYVYMSNGNDTFQTMDFSGTYSGTASITGNAFFVSDRDVRSSTPDQWSTTQVPQAPGQNATTTAPAWFPSGTGVTHTLSLTWE